MVGFSTNFTGALDAYQSVFGGQAKSDKLPQTASEQAGEAVDKPKKVSLTSPGDLLSRIVGNKLANVGFEKPQETESATGFFDIDQVVDTVSGFVAGFIERERAAGASEERIQELANAARQGVEQGFGEARDIISDAGIMTDELAEDIDTSEALIYDRIDQVVSPQDDEEEATAPSTTDGPRTDLFRPENLVSASGFNYREQSGVVEIQTNDGDTISISLASVDYSSAYYQQSQDSSSFGYTSYSGSQFSVSVDGELDEGELNALNDFLGQVDSLAQSFFSGDLDSALEQAMALDYDTSELASFSLDFAYSEIQASTRTYQNVQDLGEGARGLASLPNIVQPLKEFADEVKSVVDKASLFQNSATGLLDLLEQFIADRAENSDTSPSERIQEFAKSLFEEILPSSFDEPVAEEPQQGSSVEDLVGDV
ncbi:DUF5610 domain-containing protein [Litoribrevibacter albus]|uniref:DUF5610 domain-containing protein n=1 Tax=Litoribrevibacter albus TaxID=1473156 RepID=A0AA37SBD4_9GAMM|nr:DUF5610 domain-containing protein [Litoribrevibacter albus]GLQ31925.1 hypothetical protein GCM10007876_24040 [Litoribrevibacter albus]